MSRWAKILILLIGLAAMLYVLISPLPELDATHHLHFANLLFALLVVRVIHAAIAYAVTTPWPNNSPSPRQMPSAQTDFCNRRC